MKDTKYQQICATILQANVDLSELIRDHESKGEDFLSLDTLLCIRSQEMRRYLHRSLRFHRQKKQLTKYLSRYKSSTESIASIAASIKFSSCMLARLFIEEMFPSLTKKQISDYLRQPQKISDPRLQKEVFECIEMDKYQSPYADRVRRNLGIEYEYILYEKLRNSNIPFENEDTLRNKGLAKTPDARLIIPIGVISSSGKIQVVNWIDSKAMFGDRTTHETENLQQVQGYVNRFGPGMVIYWFGCVDNLNSDADILVVDSFPTRFIFPGESISTNTEKKVDSDTPFVAIDITHKLCFSSCGSSTSYVTSKTP